MTENTFSLISTEDRKVLFSPCRIGSRLAPNRFVAQAMEASDAAADGAVSERTLQRYLRLARGQWGVVFVEATSVTAASLGRLKGLLLTEPTLATFEKLVCGFKEQNPSALLMIQLTHSGRLSHPQTDRTTSAPEGGENLRPLAKDEIEQIRQQFIAAALLAYKAGFDGIDFKLCHGYLGTELLRPANVRTDHWGGSFENRTRFLSTAIQDIRAQLPAGSQGFVLGTRISFYERSPGGCGTSGPSSSTYDPTETFALIRLLHKLELDYVNVSGDVAELEDTETMEPEEQQVETLLYERLTHSLVQKLSLRDERDASMTVIGTGYSELREGALPVAARRLRAGHTDLVGFGRQSFADPLFPVKVQDGKPVDYCAGCYACARLMLSGRLAGCVVYGPY